MVGTWLITSQSPRNLNFVGAYEICPAGLLVGSAVPERFVTATFFLLPDTVSLMLAGVRRPQSTGRAMPIVECPYCEAKLKALAEYKGHQVKCSKCGKSFVLRFTDHDATIIAKASRRPAELPPGLETTVVFPKPDSSKSASAAEPTARAPEPSEPEAPAPEKPTKKPHGEK